VRLGGAVEEQKRWPVAADDNINLCHGSLDSLSSKSGKEVHRAIGAGLSESG